MKQFYFSIIIIFLILFTIISKSRGQKLINYQVSKNPWEAGLGNHRAVLQIDKPADAVHLQLTWRRHDRNPEWKRFIIIHIPSGDTIQNIQRIAVNNEQCKVAFGPVTKSGKYHFYYLPFETQGGHGFYSKNYLKKELDPDKDWVEHNKLDEERDIEQLPKAKCLKFESRTAFDSFYPMEVIALESEKKDYTAKLKNEYQLFAEDRKFPVRMNDNIPQRWLDFPQPAAFFGEASKNEYYVFQIALWADEKDIENVTIEFGNLTSGGAEISKEAFTCFNTNGVDPNGNEFLKKLDVEKGKVQAFWIGIDIPENIWAGNYNGNLIVKTGNSSKEKIALEIKVKDDVLADRGDSETWRYSRLRWLNSTAGIDDNPVAPYDSIKYIGNRTYDLTGKILKIGTKGLPEKIEVYGNRVLAAPISLIVETDLGIERLGFVKEIELLKYEKGIASCSWKQYAENVELSGIGTIESDGWMNYKIKIKTKKDLNVKDIRLEIPFKKEMATYMMGMGLSGQLTPNAHESKWEGPQDSFWVGNVKGGLHCELRGATYSGPLLNLYKPAPPPSWNNDGKGGFKIQTTAKDIKAIVYSGPRNLNTGDEVEFEFSLLITPVRKLDTEAQFTNRYYHNGGDPWPGKGELDANVKIINVHHANKFNPHINYPFIAVDEMKSFVDHWHQEGMKVKAYYTIRELTNHVTEIWALRSFGDEILSDGRGGGYPWLREHFVDHYRPQWYDSIDAVTIDASVLTGAGESRWFNYYIEGLKWLVKNVGLDGLYLDDVSFDRNMLKRMRKVMSEVKSGCMLDLHSNTGFSKGPAIQYTDFFPYLDKLWFGESFKYDEMSPANWLVEVSGIPFGHMGDMLHGGGNPWRGMVYGMTVRHPWTTEGVICDPRSIWKVWDSFGIADSKMVGYWDDNPIVQTGNTNVKATAYVRDDEILISIASWEDGSVSIKLDIDWKAVGIDKSNATFTALEIENFQPEKIFEIDEEIPMEPTKGWLIIIKNK